MKFAKIVSLIVAIAASYHFFKGSESNKSKKIEEAKVEVKKAAEAVTNEPLAQNLEAQTEEQTQVKIEEVIQQPEETKPLIKTETPAEVHQKPIEQPKKFKLQEKIAEKPTQLKPTTSSTIKYKFPNQSVDNTEKNSPEYEAKTTKELGPELAKTESLIKENSQPKKVRDRTEGHYLGASYNYVETSFHDQLGANDNLGQVEYKPSSKDNGYGLGLSYKYAFNFNKFYIAPGILWEKYWNSVKGTNRGHEESFANRYRDIKQLDLRYRYGITSDFGYDFSKLFSGYVSVGYVANGFKAKDGLVADREIYENASINRLDPNFLFGAGFNIKISNNLSLNLEANTQKFKVRTRLPLQLNNHSDPESSIDVTDYKFNNRFSGRINVFKVGLMYNF